MHGVTGHSLRRLVPSYFIVCLTCLCFDCPLSLNCPSDLCLSVHILFVLKDVLKCYLFYDSSPNHFSLLPQHHQQSLLFLPLSRPLHFCYKSYNVLFCSPWKHNFHDFLQSGIYLLKLSIQKGTAEQYSLYVLGAQKLLKQM